MGKRKINGGRGEGKKQWVAMRIMSAGVVDD